MWALGVAGCAGRCAARAPRDAPRACRRGAVRARPGAPWRSEHAALVVGVAATGDARRPRPRGRSWFPVARVSGSGSPLGGPSPSEGEAKEDFGDPEDPRNVLRVSRGTDFGGLLAARREAAEAARAAGDAAQEAKVEAAFRSIIASSEARLRADVERSGGSPASLFAFANFKQTIGDVDEAEALLEALGDEVAGVPEESRVDCLNQLGMLKLESRGDFAQAAACFDRALVLSPGNVDVLFNVAALRKAQGDAAAAREVLDTITAADPALAEHPLFRQFADSL